MQDQRPSILELIGSRRVSRAVFSGVRQAMEGGSNGVGQFGAQANRYTFRRFCAPIRNSGKCSTWWTASWVGR